MTSPFGKGGSRGICSAGINPIPVHQLFSNPSQPPFSKGRSRLGKFAQRSVATNRYRCWTSLSTTCSIFVTVVDFLLWKRGIEGDLQRRYQPDSRSSVVFKSLPASLFQRKESARQVCPTIGRNQSVSLLDFAKLNSTRSTFVSVVDFPIWTPPRLQASRLLVLRYDCTRISGL